MLLSMTGFGEARREQNGVAAAVELRTVNSRYFKLSLRITEGYGALEPQIEGVLRQRVKRGTVQANVTLRRDVPDGFRLNTTALESYRRQIEQLCRVWGIDEGVNPASLLDLPGVVDETAIMHTDVSVEWTVLRPALEEALDQHDAMRRSEGDAMASNLSENCDVIAAQLAEIERRAPEVADKYRQRLHERVQKLLQEFQVTLDSGDLLREVSLFAERCDISEETVRLRSHVEQFRDAMNLPESNGRKLEFITQEMFRETNTVGAKANDTEIAKRVIEIKSAIERIREMVQNVE